MTVAQTADPHPVLVLGATGAQGSAALRALLAAGVPVRALVRDAAKAQALTNLGATLAVGNFEDESSLVAACHGVRAVFSMQNAPFADKDSERQDGRNIVAAAKAAGVPHMVHTSVSGTGAYHRAAPGWDAGRWERNYWESKADVEDAVRSAGFGSYTIVKPAFMMENFTRPKADFMFPDLIDDGLVTALAPETKLNLVAADDIGRVVAAAVLDPERFGGAEIELGGDSLTMAEIAATLSAATGRSIIATSLSAEAVIARGQFPGWVSSQEWQVAAGYPATPADAQVFGITPLTFAEWANRNAEWIARR
jgi:uncharacterized protein YbjT (DUF2867 family)